MALVALPEMRRRYACRKAAAPAQLDGRLDKAPWTSLAWTDPFLDILGEGAAVPRFETRAKMAWTDTHLLVAAWLEEPHVWGTLTQRDSVIFHDNDFEVFLDPDGDALNYLEIEVNALNTVWDLFLPRPYREGGPALDDFDLKGLETAVHVKGCLNDPSDIDQGWGVEIALPFERMRSWAGMPCPPSPGDVWRINFSRVQWQHDIVDGRYVKRPGLPEDNWVWSPQGVVDMHQPEQWGELEFCL